MQGVATTTTTGNRQVRLTIIGEPASKANSRRIVLIGGQPRVIKSEKALAWLKSAERQVPIRHPLMTGPLVVYVRIFYSTQRPDLDPSLIFDFLQGRVFENDRQLREQHLFHAIDRDAPRAEVVLEPWQPCML